MIKAALMAVAVAVGVVAEHPKLTQDEAKAIVDHWDDAGKITSAASVGAIDRKIQLIETDIANVALRDDLDRKEQRKMQADLRREIGQLRRLKSQAERGRLDGDIPTVFQDLSGKPIVLNGQYLGETLKSRHAGDLRLMESVKTIIDGKIEVMDRWVITAPIQIDRIGEPLRVVKVIDDETVVLEAHEPMEAVCGIARSGCYVVHGVPTDGISAGFEIDEESATPAIRAALESRFWPTRFEDVEITGRGVTACAVLEPIELRKVRLVARGG